MGTSNPYVHVRLWSFRGYRGVRQGFSVVGATLTLHRRVRTADERGRGAGLGGSGMKPWTGRLRLCHAPGYARVPPCRRQHLRHPPSPSRPILRRSVAPPSDSLRSFTARPSRRARRSIVWRRAAFFSNASICRNAAPSSFGARPMPFSACQPTSQRGALSRIARAIMPVRWHSRRACAVSRRTSSCRAMPRS